MKNTKRLYFLITIIITLGLLLGFAPQPVQASIGTTDMSILRTGISPRLDVFNAYLRAIHYGVGFDDEDPEPVIDRQLEDFVSTVSNGSSSIAGVYINGTLAMPIVQQPSGNAGWVSEAEELSPSLVLPPNTAAPVYWRTTHMPVQHFSTLKADRKLLWFSETAKLNPTGLKASANFKHCSQPARTAILLTWTAAKNYRLPTCFMQFTAERII